MIKKGKKMKVLDLFCGTKSIANAFEKRGHEVYTVDWNADFKPTLCADIGAMTAADIIKLCGGVPDVIWASPDCTTFSVMAISTHRRKAENGILFPKSDYAKMCDKIDAHVIDLIQELKPRYWFIENPRAGMRKARFMQDLNKYRHTVTYCQYGDRRMKPTDIWTNHPQPDFKPPCKNGDPCHESSPRWSTVKKLRAANVDIELGGTQYGFGGSAEDKARERSKIPEALCNHIVDICEKGR